MFIYYLIFIFQFIADFQFVLLQGHLLHHQELLAVLIRKTIFILFTHYFHFLLIKLIIYNVWVQCYKTHQVYRIKSRSSTIKIDIQLMPKSFQLMPLFFLNINKFKFLILLVLQIYLNSYYY